MTSGAGMTWGAMRNKLRRQEERLSSQRALQESEERLALAAASANIGVWSWNVQNWQVVWTWNAIAFLVSRQEHR